MVANNTSYQSILGQQQSEIEIILRDHCSEYDESRAGVSGTELKKQNVSFATTCNVKFILALQDYTRDEISSSWYNKDEYSQIRRKCVQIVSRVIRGTSDSDRYCTRGLERMTPINAAHREVMREMVYLAVFSEQEKQWSTRVQDPEAIKRTYRQVAATQCQQAAHQIGLRDALIAMQSLRKSRCTISKRSSLHS